MKRIFDLVVSAILLCLLFPVFFIVGFLIALRLGTPVFFIQTRPGLGGKPFNMLKFRTMLNSRDADGNLLSDELRLTRFGRILRSTSLDELPGLINVLKGDMSLVGPRPLLMEYLPLYNKEQATRHNVRPGITGWAQINGRNALTWEEKFALDIWYVENRSLFLDLKILFLTLIVVFRRSGISSDSHVTMDKFKGSNLR